MFLHGHMQNAYVTHDLDKAMEIVGDRFGFEKFHRIDPVLTIKTPKGVQPMSSRVASYWAGGLNIEIIEPVSGYVDDYLTMLPADKSDAVPRFHHISLRRDNYEEMQAEIARLGLPFVCEGGIPDLLYTYLDGRSTFGHYVEYVWASPAGWQMIGWPEGRSVA